MGTGPDLLGIVAVSAYALLWIGLPVVLINWTRKRRDKATRQQIALTDAIHWQLGAVVSPVVEHPLWGPRRVRIAAPLREPATVGRVLAVTHAVLSVGEPASSRPYRIILTHRQDLTAEEGVDCTQKPVERWSGRRSVAAA